MLSERKKKILSAIVEAYTESDNMEPIGSHSLLQLIGMDVSSATLRNEMAELEELGYLEKTHTSSGRVPTAKGYRLYVDELVNLEKLFNQVNSQVENYIASSKLSKKETCMNLLINVINNPSFNYSALSLDKTSFNSRIKKIDFVHLKNYQGLFMIVTDQGDIFSREVMIPNGISISNIEKTVAYFNSKLENVLLNDFKRITTDAFDNQTYFDYMDNSHAVIELILRNLSQLIEDQRQIISPYNILHHQDFSDINFAQDYLDMIKNESIYRIIDFDNGPIPVIGNSDGANISVVIGDEHHNKVLNNLASITVYYKSSEGTGAITVYGPLRMKYKYIIALLLAIANNIN